MKNIKTYYIVLMLTVFSWPTIFQSIHVISHHNQQAYQYCDHSDQQPIQKTGGTHPGMSIDQYKEGCAICDFQLTDQKITQAITLQLSFEHYFFCLQSRSEKIHIIFTGNHKNRRAPPIVIV